MLSTAHCSTHPSHEAHQRCRACGRWLCERCAQLRGGHIYCSLACRLRDVLGRATAATRALVTLRVPAPWALAVVAGLSTLLLAAVGTRVAELIELVTPPATTIGTDLGPASSPAVHGRVVVEPRGTRVEVEGPPGAAVVLVSSGQPLAILGLDEDGRGTVSGLDMPFDAEPVELILLAGSVVRASVERLPPPTASPTPRATANPTPRPTARASALPTPRPVPSQAEGGRNRPGRPARAPVLHLVGDAGERIALTFDGGATNNGTAELLDLLRSLRLRVTMFVTGEFIERHPHMVRSALLDGHEIGNHTYSHPHLTTWAEDQRHRLLPGVNRDLLADQLTRTERAFWRATGQRMAPLWRAPYGEENNTLRAWALEMGYLHVRWSSIEGASLDTLDWVSDEHSGLYRQPERMLERLLRFPHLEGGIVLMHLGSDRREPPWRILPSLVSALAERSIEPVTVSELLTRSPSWRPWLEQATENLRARTAGPPPAETPE